MGILDRLRGKRKKPGRAAGGRGVAPVLNAIARVSDASDKERVGVAIELLKSSNHLVRARVASEVARLEIKGVGVWYELANAMADDYEVVRLASAKAFWQLDGVCYAIRSLLDEHENPAHMTRDQALEGIRALMMTASDKSVFIALLRENWPDCPKLADLEKEGVPVVPENEQRDKADKAPVCAKCRNSFAWEESYVTQETPGSAPFHPPGTGDTRPRLFCPHCGTLVMDWHITKSRDFDEWIWYGNNKTVNCNTSFPPSPYSHGTSKGILYALIPKFSRPVLDITKVKAWEKKKADEKKAREEQPETPPDTQALTEKEDVKGLIDALREDRLSKTHEGAVEALTGIGAPAVEPLIGAFKNAKRADNYYADKDRNLRDGIVEALDMIGDPRAVETFLLALDDNIPFVRLGASNALDHMDEAVITSEALKMRKREVIQALRWAAENDRDPKIYEKAKAMLKVITGSDR